MKKRNKKLAFRTGNQNQPMLFPPSLEDFIPPKHPVRIVNQIIDTLDLRYLYEIYNPNGAPPYNPKMMLKILFFGYMQNIFSSRKLEAAIQENVYFMWLAGMQKPDHNTINNFRGKRLEPVLKRLFRDIVIHLHDAGLITLKDIYTDGTKIEANANKFTFIWKKAVQGRQEKMLERINSLWDYAVSVTKIEMEETRPETPEELTPERVQEIVDALNKTLQDYEIDQKKKCNLNEL